MKSIGQLMADLRSAKVRVWEEDAQLRYRAPKGALTPELLAEMGSRKTELIEFCSQAKARPSRLPLGSVPREGRLPISLAQQRLWVLDQLEGPGPTYNIALALQLTGALDSEILLQSFAAVIRRHESLRTTFSADDDGVWQVIADGASPDLTVVDLQHLPEDRRLDDARRRAREEALRPFDLSNGPLVRFMLWQLGGQKHVLMVTMHHIISDGRSIEVLTEEIAALYQAYVRGVEADLPELHVQYADFAYYQRQWLTDEILIRQLDYWRQRLADLPPLLELPTDRVRPPLYTSRGDTLRCTLEADLVNSLKQLSREWSATLFTTLMAGFATLLSRYTARNDIPIGCPVTIRDRPEIESLIGFFINTLVFRIDVDGNSTFRKLVAGVRDIVTQGFESQDLPFEKLVEELDVERNSSYPPLVQVTVMMLDGKKAMLNLPGLATEPFDFGNAVSKFDLSLEIYESRGGLEIFWIYNSDLFFKETVGRMARHLQNLLRGAAREPDRRLADLPLLEEAERHQIVVAWNDTSAEFPQNQCIHQLFEAQAEHTPHAVAVAFQSQQLTYAELNVRANRLAHHLIKLGVGPEGLVAICVERSFEMVVGLLGVLKAGGAYVPLDPEYPPERLAFMVQDCKAAVLLTQDKFVSRLPRTQNRLVCLDSDWEEVASEGNANPDHRVKSRNLAYVVYTSGSTGRPKGALLEHRSVVNYLSWARRAYDVAGGAGAPVNSSIGFDATVTSLFTPLISGRRIELLPETDEIEHLRGLLQSKQNFSLVKITPAYLQLLRPLSSEEPFTRQTRAFIIGGEALSAGHLDYWRKFAPGVRLINEYGPTETVVGCCVYDVPCAEALPENIPIGRPISNCQLYVLDQYLQPVPAGVLGELFIGGDGVGRGYLNRREMTADKFVPDPFGNTQGGRLYKTGDSARFLPDGNLEFLGRTDHQVKMRGFRIELGEIEAALSAHEQVHQCVVVACQAKSGSQRLAAYVVAANRGGVPSNGELRRYLSESLPNYMVPSVFVRLLSLPLTSNGKVDRRALPEPEWSRNSLESGYEPPRSHREQRLVEIWQQSLGIDRVGVHDNFFELGGDSILSIQVAARAKQAGLEYSPRDLFQHQTIAELAAVAGSLRQIDAEQGPVIGSAPLTAIQSWFFEQPPPWHHFNQTVLLQGPVDLNVDFLSESVRCLVGHHDALRLRFEQHNGSWQQVFVAPDTESSSELLTVVDLSSVADQERSEELQSRAAAAQSSLQLSTGPLLRAVWFDYGIGQRGFLLLVIHHLAVDGISWRILLEDLVSIYEQLTESRRVNLPAKTTPYRSWAERLAQHAQSAGALAERSYWREVLQKPCVLPIDSEVDAAANTVDSEAQVKVYLSELQTRALLHDVPTTYHSQINDVLLTALLRSFVRWQLNRGLEPSGLLLDLEGHGREEVFSDIDLSRTTGWFTTLFPVYLDVERDMDPGQALKSVKEQLRKVPERGLGYGLLRYLNAQTAEELSALPPPQLSFNYLGQFDTMLASASLWQLADRPIGPAQSAQRQRGHLLEINGLVAGGQLQLVWSYSQAVHRLESIEELTQLFLDELCALIEHCLSSEAGGHTPSDFPLARLTQSQLEHIEQTHPTLEDLYPLSPLQQGLLFHTLYDLSSPMYFEQLCVTLEGRLSPPVFRQAWQKVMDRHPVLRSAILHEGYETALQMVWRDVVLPYHEHDWRDQSESQQEKSMTALLEQDRREGFDLAEPPLMRVTLIRLAEEKWAFVWSHQHLVLDGWSVSIVSKEVLGFYRSALTGQSMRLASVRPYREHIGWLQSRDVSQAVSFWQERLRGFTEPTLVALPLPSGVKPDEEKVAEHQLWLTAETTERLRAFAREQRMTLNTLVQGAWAMLLSRYARQADVVFGATVSGRSTDLPGINEMVGLFINTLPVRIQIEAEAKLSPWLRELQARHAEEQRYAYCPLVEVQRQSDVPANQSLFDSLFVFENYPVDESLRETELFDDLTITNVRAATRTNYPLALVVIPGRQLAVKFWYAEQRFENGSIERMAGHMETLLLGMLSRPDCRLRELPMLTQPEQHTMLVEWNDTLKACPWEKCIHELFEQQAERSPNAVAAEFGGRQLTYRELNARANRVAHYLSRAERRGRTVSPGMLVGIFMDRSLEMVIGLLGILKAGAAYVPLDSDYPRSRLALLMDDSQMSVLLTQRDLVNKLPNHCARVICLDRDWELIARESEDNPGNSITAEQIAYVIYTSGSTGVPKGVTVSHRAVNRLALNTDYIRLDASDKVAQASNASFDAATFEIWGALLNGAQLVGIERDVTLSPQQFVACLRQREITTLFLTTALFNLMARDAADAFQTLRHLLFGGEAVDAKWVRQVLKCGPPERLLHVYGPTENTTFSSWYVVSDVPEGATRVPIGRPIANTQIYLLDRDLQPVPIGVPGELFLGGEGLADGYLNRPALTAEQFIPNPYSEDGASRLYRTGDMARYLFDGNIEFLGRFDNQIKIRGFRIELGEIEAVLGQHSTVHESVVTLREDHPGEKHLVAYVVPDSATSGVGNNRNGNQAFSAAEMRSFLHHKLPDYMVPSALVILEKMPLNSNGKIDRRALPPPEKSRLEESYVAPRTPTEEILAAIHAGVLRLPRVGVYDNFFDLGGHSLLATQVSSRVRNAFSLDLPLRCIFESPTVAALAKTIETARAVAQVPSLPIQSVSRDGQVSLSFAQERLWFLDQLEPENPFYNVPEALRLQGPLNVAALEQSLNEVIRRHEVLRTVFPQVDGRPSQFIVESLNVMLSLTDLSELSENERSTQLDRMIAEDAKRPFDLATGPLLRASLVRCGHAEHVLLFCMHHIVSDGWSLGVLIGELAPLYVAFCRGEDSPLDDLPIQYADFAAWQREWLSGRELQDQLAYWRDRLAGILPVLELSTDRPRPPAQSYRGSSVKFAIDAEVAGSLRALSRQSEATLFMTLFAGFATLLFRYSGQEDIVIGSPIANRNRAEIEPLIGFFVNTLALRVDLSGNPTFEQLLLQVRQIALEAYAHQDLPFEQLVDEIRPERDLSLNPLFQVMFALQNMPLETLDLAGLTISTVESKRIAALFDLVLDMWETGSTLTGILEYNTDLFDEVTVRRMVGHFQRLLREVATQPGRRLSDLPLLTEDEQHWLLSAGTGPQITYPVDQTIHELFEKMVTICPHRVAASHNGAEIRYSELNAQANQIAHRLRRFGVRRNDLVGILDRRGLDLLAAMLGVLKAGGAFLPIDAGYPAERINYMLADSRLKTLITRSPLFSTARVSTDATNPRNLLYLDQDDLAEESVSNPTQVNSSRDVAYVLYTSGSTGLPKGAMIRHDGAVNHIFAEFDLLHFHKDTAFLQSAPSSSDISVWQFLAPGLIGGRTVIADFETVCDPALLLKSIKSHRITLIELVPVVMQELLNSLRNLSPEERQLPDLEWAMVTGEAAPVSLVQQWLETLPSVKLINAYGPTEAADDICQFELDKPLSSERRTVPIGRPLPNLTLYILDRNLRLVPPGVTGEICVSGIGVGAGYWGDDKRTHDAFMHNPFADGGRGDVLYRTGDLGRWRVDGSLEFLGRLDHQVKVRGFRIELGEIEGVLCRHPAVREGVVTVREDNAGDKQLVSYVVPDVEAEEIRDQLRELKREQIELWRDLHEDSYRDTLIRGDVTFNAIGWDSNYTAAPLPEVDMHEYVDFSIERILSLNPRRVLEIGCGTGLIMFPLLPHCESYTGTDLSHVSIEQLRQLRDSEELRGRIRGLDRAELTQKRADDFDWIKSDVFDTVLLPSVVQYFPGIEYLLQVLEGVIRRVLRPGGSIFVGDVRSLPLLEAFHASVQLYKAKPSDNPVDVAERAQRQAVQEQEMAIDPAFFLALKTRFPQISHVEILPKRGFHHNEMTRFRYDVLIHLADKRPPGREVIWSDWQKSRPDVGELRRCLVEQRPSSLALRRVPNLRVQKELTALGLLSGGNTFGDVSELKSALDELHYGGLEPEDLWQLGKDLSYRVDISLANSYADGSFDVVFQRDVDTASPPPLFADEVELQPWNRYANNPLHEKLERKVTPLIREFLKEKLPNYMVPSDFVLLQHLPLTPAGKVDRQSLPAPDLSKRILEKGFVAPRNREEQALARIWADVLGLEQVGVTNNFFELGGHSLKATQVVSRIHRDLQVEIALRDIFNHPTIAELAANIGAGETAQFVSIPEAPEAEHYPLSHAQRRLWVLAQMENGSAAYNMPMALLLEGLLDAEAFQTAFSTIVQRHESLRTAFVIVDGVPRQRIVESVDRTIEERDLSEEDQPEAAARELALADAAAPFDLQRGNLIRTSLLKLGDNRHVLLCNMHHIISDAWSMDVLVREFVQLYAAISRGETLALPELPIQYRDYACWQNDYLISEAAARHREYWHRKLAGELPVLNLATDLPRPPEKTFHGRNLAFRIGSGETAALTALGRRQNASLFMTLVALVKTLLYRYTGQEEILIGFPIAGRYHSELEDQIGFYINTLPLRDHVRPDASFEQLLEQVKTTATEAYEHQIYPFDRLVDELNLSRDVSRSPMFDVVVVMQNTDDADLPLEGIAIRPFVEEYDVSKFDLSFTFEEGSGGLRADITYNTDLFVPERIERIGNHLRELVASVLADSTSTVEQLNILPKSERHKVLAEFSPTPMNYPSDQTLVDLFESQVKKTPDRLAVIFEESAIEGISDSSSTRQQLTYCELNARANQLARHLINLGVRPGALVGICVERSIEMVVGILGILKAGGAYVPFDPAHPRDRLAFMLDDAHVSVLVTQEQLVAELSGSEMHLVCVDRDRGVIAREVNENPDQAVSPDDVAYVIYTSGSTGRPKGVPITHANVARLFAATEELFGFDEHDVWTLFHSYAFDFSVWELWGALLYGGRVVVVPYWVSRSPSAFYELLEAERVTVLNQTPSAFRHLIQVEEDTNARRQLELRYVIFGGEALDLRSLRPWFDRHGDRQPQLINMYGITETTVHVTYRPLTLADSEQTASLIGRPIPDLQIYILDRQRQPAPIGVPGEMYVGGAGLAKGYLHREELTRERFVPDPFSSDPHTRLYRSGDLARYLPDGEIEYLGRIDQQVQIRGFRVELGEIEAALTKHPGVRDTVVIAHARGDETRLVAYFIASAEATPNTTELRRYLQDRLPDYMVPSAFVPLDAFPLTPNGKLDRRALLDPGDARPQVDAAYVRPGNEMEQTIAAILQELLGLGRVGIHDNFFDLGAHSLLIMQAHRKLQEVLDREVPVVMLFKYPTVGALARYLTEPTGEASPAPSASVQEHVAKQKAARHRHRQRRR